MQHGSVSRISTRIYVLRSEQKRTFFNKKANRARKDLTFPGGNETIRSNDEGRRNLKEIESLSNGNGLVHLVLTQQIKDYNYIILNLKQDR